MSPTPTFFSPKFSTEWYGHVPFQNCQWAAGLMLANKAGLGKYPATNAEVDALRGASGDHFGGSSLQDLARGIHARYGWYFPVGVSWTGLLTRLNRGDGAVVDGKYAKLPTHYTRFDPHFASLGDLSGHAMYVQGHDRGQNWHRDKAGNLTDVFLMDPLGHNDPGTPPDAKYRGEWLPVSALHAFVNGLANDASLLVATMAQGSIS